MLKNAPTLAIVAVHTEENEPPKVLKPKISFISFGSLTGTAPRGSSPACPSNRDRRRTAEHEASRALLDAQEHHLTLST